MKCLINGWWRLCLGVFLPLMAGVLTSPAAEEQTFPVLITKSGAYTNVTVTTQGKDYIFVLHSTGMANIRLEELSDETLEQMGYAVNGRKSGSGQKNVVTQLLPALETKLKPIEATLRSNLKYDPELLKPSRNQLLIAGAVLLFLHLFYSYCCHLIAIKSGKKPTLLAWIPVFQSIPLLRAAEMSGWWFLFLWVPIVPILWAFKIAKVREMSVLVSIALLLPVTNVLAFLLLAFGKGVEPKPKERYQSMSLQTA